MSSGSYVVYGRRSGKLLRALGAFVIVLLVLLLGAAVWSSSAGAQDQAPRAQDMARGAVEGLDTKEQPNPGGERAEGGRRNVEAPELVGIDSAEVKGALETFETFETYGSAAD